MRPLLPFVVALSVLSLGSRVEAQFTPEFHPGPVKDALIRQEALQQSGTAKELKQFDKTVDGAIAKSVKEQMDAAGVSRPATAATATTTTVESAPPMRTTQTETFAPQGSHSGMPSAPASSPPRPAPPRPPIAKAPTADAPAAGEPRKTGNNARYANGVEPTAYDRSRTGAESFGLRGTVSAEFAIAPAPAPQTTAPAPQATVRSADAAQSVKTLAGPAGKRVRQPFAEPQRNAVPLPQAKSAADTAASKFETVD